MKNLMSVSRKLNIFIILLITLLALAGSVVSVFLFNNMYENQIDQMVRTASKALYQNITSEKKEELIQFSNRMEHLLTDTMEEENTLQQRMLDLFVEYNDLDGLSFLQIYEKDQLIFERSEESLLPQFQEKPKLTKTKVEVIGTQGKGILMVCSMPWLLSSGEQQGTIRVGIQLARQTNVDKIKEVTGYEASIFSGDTRYVTTIAVKGILAKGQPMDPKVSRAVLEQGSEYTGGINILGSDYYSCYIPLRDSEDQVVGAVASGISMKGIQQVRFQSFVFVLLVNAALSILFVAFSRRWLDQNISQPVYRAVRDLDQVMEGHYLEQKEGSPQRTKEFYQLTAAIRTMAISVDEQQEKLKALAYADSLTGLPNKAMMSETYRNSSWDLHSRKVYGICYLDLDNFKYINHLFGNEIGDALLIQVAQRLQEFAKDRYPLQVYKVSGDEFVLCQNLPVSPEVHLKCALALLEVFREKFEIDQYKIHASVSIGSAILEENSEEDFESLYEKAEIAMNQAKLRGKNQMVIFDPDMNVALQKNALIQQELRTALSKGEIYLVYQPKFNFKLQEYDGFEALIRWNHPQRGMVPPPEFIKAAEETGQIHEIGRWVLETACRFISEFNVHYQTSVHMAVNISPVQLLDESFEEDILEILQRCNVAPEQLELEITESVLIHSFEIVTEKLLKLREQRIQIALDDFGTGYSSLNYIKSLPITTLKLDKTFSDDIVTDPIAFEIVESVVKIAKSTGLKTVVEGIETKEQVDLLAPMEIDYIQGYYYSKPLSVEEMDDAVVRYRKKKRDRLAPKS